MSDGIIKLFHEQGFCLIKKEFFSKGEISEIKDEIKKTLHNLTIKKHSDTSVTVMGGKSVLIRRVTEHNEFIFDKINQLLQNSEIKDFLKNTLGSNYKIPEVIYRHSEPGDTGLGIHQDAENEHAMVVNLDDTSDIDGSTIFLKKSHQFFLIKKIFPNSSISEKVSNKLIFLFNWIKGKSGDIGFFNNKVWHGRAGNKKDKMMASILIGFYPSGSIVRFSKNHTFFSESYLKKNEGEELANRQNFNSGTELLEDYDAKTYKIRKDEDFKNQSSISKNYLSLKFLIFLIISKILYTFKR